MTVTVDETADPYIDASGNFAEVLGHLKNQNVSEGSVIALVWDGTSIVHCVYRR